MLKFHEPTFFKFVRKDHTSAHNFQYILGSNIDSRKIEDVLPDPELYATSYEIGLFYTDINGLKFFEKSIDYYGDVLAIVKIPIEVPIINMGNYKYKSHTVYIEKFIDYKEFLSDNTIVPEIKRTMKIPDLRMSLFFSDVNSQELLLKAVKGDANNFFHIPTEKLTEEIILKVCDEKWLKYDVLKKIYRTSFAEDSSLIKKMIAKNSDFVFIYEKLFTEEYIEVAIRSDPKCFFKLNEKNRTLKLCEVFIENYKGYFELKYSIPCFSKEILSNLFLKAMQTYGENYCTLPYTFKSDENLILAAVKSNGYAVRYVAPTYRSEEVCLEAVKSEPLSIFYLKKKERTEKVCLEALERNCLTLEACNSKYIRDKDYIEAVKKVPSFIKYVPHRLLTEEMCTEAVKRDPETLINLLEKRSRFVTVELCKLAFCKIKYFKITEMKEYLPDRLKTVIKTVFG